MRIYKCANWIEKCVFCAFIFLVPLQTRKIFYFWGNEFNEWMSISLYVTDILVFALFVFWIKRIIVGNGKIKLIAADYFLFALIVWSGIGVFFAANFYLGVFRWIKLAEMIFVFFYVRNFLMLNGKNGLARILWILVVSAFAQSTVAVAQFFKQSDLGLRIFHESPIGVLADGVAKIDIDGLKIVRAYGLFPHPNILAAFLGVAIFACLWLLVSLYLAPRPGRNVEASGTRRAERAKIYILLFMLAVIFMGLFLTFSRSAIISTVFLSFLFLCFAYFSGKEHLQKKKILEIFIILFVFAVVLFLLLQPLILDRFNVSAGEQAVSLRSLYNKVAFDFMKKSPFFGVGIGNFVSSFQVSDFPADGETSKFQISLKQSLWNATGQASFWQYQPAHNLYLLIASEVGVVGLILFLAFFGLLFWCICMGVSPIHQKVFIVSCLLLFFWLGLFDHYFWTLQQGMLMMWIVFGIVAGVSYSSSLSIRRKEI